MIGASPSHDSSIKTIFIVYQLQHSTLTVVKNTPLDL